MPSLKDLYVKEMYSFKESFNRYMIHAGKASLNYKHLFHKIYPSIYSNTIP